MRTWVKWCVNHKLGWFVKTLVWLSFPVTLLTYWAEAVDATLYTIHSIDEETEDEETEDEETE
jgi:hypothetical protein